MRNTFKVRIPAIGIKETYVSSSSQIRARKLMRRKYDIAENVKIILIPVTSEANLQL